MSTATLTASLSTLDADTFTALWREHRDDIRAWLWRRCPTSADELVSETFCRAWAGRSTYRPEAGPARGWLYGIARSALVDWLRYEGRRPLVFWPDLVDSALVDRVDLAAEVAERTAALAALAGLPERYRLVLVLRFVFDLNVSGTAEALGWTVPAVKAMTHRAMAAARDATGGAR